MKVLDSADPAGRCWGWSFEAIRAMLTRACWQSEAWACLDAEWKNIAMGVPA